MNNWAEFAACRGVPLEFFYVKAGEGSSTETQMVKRICESCPVRTDCLAEALRMETNMENRHGIWGGMTPNERDHRWRELTGKVRKPQPFGVRNCSRGHLLDEANSYVRKDGAYLECRTCRSIRVKENKNRNRRSPMPVG